MMTEGSMTEAALFHKDRFVAVCDKLERSRSRHAAVIASETVVSQHRCIKLTFFQFITFKTM